MPALILIATGSEVALAVAAAESLTNLDVEVRVVSMPCTNIFDQQGAEYRESVLPSSVTARIAIEAGHEDYWHKYVGIYGRVVGMSTFGKSAPCGTVMDHFGFTVENILETAKALLKLH